jgi:single-strand DNA-binding protein
LYLSSAHDCHRATASGKLAHDPRKDLTMPTSINRIILLGNLCRDPELRTTSGGTAICNLRLAVNERTKDAGGQWRDQASFFDVTAFGSLAEHCAKYLAKGRQVAIDGRLRWRSWEAKDGSKHEAVEVVAESVQVIGSRETAASTASVTTSTPSSVVPGDDDIPF